MLDEGKEESKDKRTILFERSENVLKLVGTGLAAIVGTISLFYVFGFVIAFQSAGKLETIDLRHHNVLKDQIRKYFADLLQRLLSIGSFDDLGVVFR